MVHKLVQASVYSSTRVIHLVMKHSRLYLSQFCRSVLVFLLIYGLLASNMAAAGVYSNLAIPAPVQRSLAGAATEADQSLRFRGAGERTATGLQLAKTRVGLASPLVTKVPAALLRRAPMLAQAGSTSGTSTISSNFNGTAIAAGNYVWFNGVIAPSGINGKATKIAIRQASVQFIAGGVNYNIALPNTLIMYSASVSSASTGFDPLKNQWNVQIPLNYSGNVFVGGTGFRLPVALPGGINPVTWTATFYTDNVGITANWKWAAAIYTQFSADNTLVGAKPIDGSTANPYANSDHAGTPENYKSSVVGGARGGGGSNWTGSYSGTASVTPIQLPNEPPVANAGPDQTVRVTDTVHLDGSASTDPEGAKLTYAWNFVSRPANSAAALSDTTAVKPSFQVDRAGNYVLQLVVSDGQTTSAPDQVTISTTNSAPVADAGVDQTAHVGNTVHLDGSASSDVDGDLLTYRWTLTSVPPSSNAQLSDPSAVNPTFVLDQPGTYVAALVVNDGLADSPADQVIVSSVNSAPVANAGVNQSLQVGNTVQLDGSRSSDVDGDQLTYRWSFLSVPSGSTAVLADPSIAKPTFAADGVGTYVIQLIVNDGHVDSDPATVSVSSENTAPVADAGPDQSAALGTVVLLDGTRSSDADGQPVTYKWSITSKPASSIAQLSDFSASRPTFTADRAGEYVIQLIVNDGYQNSQPDQVRVSTINSIPVSNAGADQNARTGDTVSLDGSNSSDADGDPLTYRWSMLSQPSSATAVLSDAAAINPNFIAEVAGTYILQLIVNDGKVDSSPDTIVVEVKSTNAPPIVSAGPDQDITLPTDSVTLNGTVSDDGKPIGMTVTTEWSQVSGPGTVTFGDPNSTVTTATFSEAGSYVLQLSASDTELSASSVVNVTVRSKSNEAPVVDAGPSETIPVPNNYSLKGSVTDDGLPANGQLTIQWTQVSGPDQAVFSDSHVPASTVRLNTAGEYVLQLSASDGELSSSKTVTLTTVVGNKPPVVNAGPDQVIGLPNASTTLVGTATDDGLPTGSSLTYQWTQISGPTQATFTAATSLQTTIGFATAGLYVLQLTATDSQLTGSSIVHVRVSPPNQPPVVDAGPNQTIQLPQNTVTLNGSVTDDGLPIGGTLTSQWSVVSGAGTVVFGDTSQPFTTATFTVAGSYVLRLTVSDSKLSGYGETAVTVVAAPPIAGGAALTLSPVTAGPNVVGTNQSLSVTLKDGSGVPLAGRTVSFTVTGPNATSGSATTDPTGTASFVYAGTVTGTDSVRASTTIGTDVLASNVATVSWVNPAPRVSMTTILGRFYQGGYNVCSFPLTSTTVLFEQSFPTINFDPPGTVPGSPYNQYTSGFYNVTTDVQGNYTGAIQAQGNGYFPALSGGALQNFQAVFTGTLTIASAGNVTFNFFSDDGFVFGVGNGATRVTGVMNNPPASGVTQLQSYPIVGSYNIGSAVSGNTVTVNFPTAGSYPFELDYSECLNGEKSMTMAQVINGQNKPIPPTGTLVLSPGANSIPAKPIGQLQTFTVKAIDAGNNVLPNVQVQLIVGGANTQLLTSVTDSTGIATFTYRGLAAGNDSVQAKATITGMLAYSNVATVPWNSATNQAPVVSAGSNQTITLPSLVSLNGTATDDGLPNGTLTQNWSKVSGPGAVTFAAPDQLATQASFSTSGTYVLQLTASDSVKSSSGQVTIAVNPQPTPNQPPSVSAGPSLSAFLGDAVTLNGSVTDDGLPAGATVASTWAKVSGPGNVVFANANQATTTATFDQTGVYVLQLTATDSQYTSYAQASFAINEKPTTQNQPPQISLSAPGIIVLPNSASLAASVTDDGLPNGSLTYQWSLLAGPGSATFTAPNASSTSAAFSAVGIYTLKFAASDAQLTSYVQFSVNVVAAQSTQNVPPTVNAGPSKSIVLPTTSVSLTGIASDDGWPSGTLAVKWTQVSGPGAVSFSNPNATATTATFPTTGVYQLQLSASDGQYTATSTTTVSVSATSGTNQPPSMSVSAPGTIYLPSNTVTLSAKVVDDGLPTGSTVSLQWSQVSGPAGSASITSPTQASTQVVFTQAGSYLFQLTANDSQLTTTATVPITVQEQPGLRPVVQISLPDGTEIKTRTNISGSVSSGAWSLSYAQLNGDGTLGAATIFGSGTGPSSGILGTLDPTAMLNGTYTVTLKSQDQWAQSAAVSGTVDIDRNLKIGNFTLSFSDLSVPVPGLPITVTRTYDSRNHSVGDFGYGWTLSLANVKVSKSRNFGQGWYEDVTWSGYFPRYCLTAPNNRKVALTFPDGKVYKFQAASNPQCQQYTPIQYPNMAFTQLPTDSSTAGAKLEVDGPTDVIVEGPIPGPVDLYDYNGGYYDATKFKLTTSDGYVYFVDQQLGATKVKDPNGNTLTITPNGITHSAGQSVVFVRDSLNRITSIQDPDPNHQSITYTYDSNGDLATVTDRTAHVTTFAYDSTHPHYLNDVQYVNDSGATVHAVRNEYDENGLLKSTTDANQQTITYDHRIALNQEAVKDRLGNITVYTYDEDGNVTQTEDPEGGITYATYDSMGNKLSESNNVVTKPSVFTYDALGNRLTETDPLGHKTTYTYNTRKQVTDIVDANGNKTHNQYDNNGNLLSTAVLNSGVNPTTYTYYPNGLPNVVTDPTGAATTFTYDGAGNPKTQIDALQTKTEFVYDANSNKKTQSVKRTKADGTQETLTTNYDYDDNGRLTKTTYPDGTFTRMVFNSIGKQSDTYDAKNVHTHYDYDDNGRLTKVTYNDDPSSYEEYTYDLEGRKLTSRDRGGHTTQYVYDKVGRLKQTISLADNTSTQTIYDLAGRVQQTIDANGHATSYTYDDAGRRTSVTDALGHKTSFGYDSAGNQTSMTDAKLHTTYYDYDKLNRRYRVRYADGTQENFTYDAAGRMTDKYDQAGKHTNYVYDSLGRLTDVYLAPETLNLHTHYDYDELGNRIAQVDANQHHTSFAYDQLGRRVKRTLPLGQFETYTYDNNGNVKTRTDFNGNTTQYFYDPFNRLLCKTPSSTGDCADPRAVNFTYTATGRRATMSDPSGQTIYNYDDRDRLHTKQTPFGTLTYTYDNIGQVVSITSSNANGAAMGYTYDDLNRLSTVTVPGEASTIYGYDPAGNLTSVANPNGTTATYTYNLLNRLTRMATTAANTTVASYQYTLGAAGNRKSVSELSGRTVTYGYDDVYRLTLETISGAAQQNGAIGYEYDAAGNRKTMTSTVAAVPPGLWNYDANDRITTDTYDNNGNTIADAGTQNVYDFENHLTQRGGVTIVYDGDGNRVSETVGGATTNYLVDNENPTGYVQVVEELQNGQVVRSYTWGHWLISATQQINSTWKTSYYGYDGHGSVRFLTDTNGAVTDTYDYDAFGNLISSTGTTPNNYLFAGEQFDPALNLYYNRARYLDVRTGRFWGMDTWEGSPYDPSSLHRYLYVNGDPIGKLDPSGQFSVGEFSIAVTISATLEALSSAFIHQDAPRGEFWEQVGLGFLKGAAIGAVGYGVGAIAIKAAAPLLKATFEPLFTYIGELDRITLVGKTGWERALVRVSRFFFNTNQSYPRVGQTAVGKILQKLFPDIEWEMHHIFIQQAWSRAGSAAQLYEDVAANEGLRRVGNGLWNLIPIPRLANSALGRSAIGTAMVATAYYGSIVYGGYYFLSSVLSGD